MWRRVAFAIEFWVALILVVGSFVYGAWHVAARLFTAD
jgi:hypothetical protein